MRLRTKIIVLLASAVALCAVLVATGVISPWPIFAVINNNRQFHRTSFWGKVRDQNGAPLDSVGVVIQIELASFRGIVRGSRLDGLQEITLWTDAEGRFSVPESKFRTLSIRKLVKHGFVDNEVLPKKDWPAGYKRDRRVWSGHELRQGVAGTSREAPAVFTMHRTN